MSSLIYKLYLSLITVDSIYLESVYLQSICLIVKEQKIEVTSSICLIVKEQKIEVSRLGAFLTKRSPLKHFSQTTKTHLESLEGNPSSFAVYFGEE